MCVCVCARACVCAKRSVKALRGGGGPQPPPTHQIREGLFSEIANHHFYLNWCCGRVCVCVCVLEREKDRERGERAI